MFYALCLMPLSLTSYHELECLIMSFLLNDVFLFKQNEEDAVNCVSNDSTSFPSILIEFMEFLYSNIKVFGQFCTEKRFLQYLAATLYPLESKDDPIEVEPPFLII